MRAVLSLGSNLGNSAEILSSASEALNEVSEVIALSSFYQTRPIGGPPQPDFLNAVGDTKKYNKCLEWCAGLSAISFSLLDKNIIDKSVLMDIYEPALLTAIDNANNNKLQDRVTHYVCDNVNKIPKHEKFDLVINPKSRAWVITFKDLSYRNAGLISLKILGTVSKLWAKTSGLVSKT